MKNKFVYSTDEEMYNGGSDTKEEAIFECINEEDPAIGDIIYIGEKESKTFAEYFDVDDIFDQMNERAYENVHPDVVNSWPYDELNEKNKRELEQLILDWADRNGLDPSFYGVTNVEKIEITQELIDKSDAFYNQETS